MAPDRRTTLSTGSPPQVLYIYKVWWRLPVDRVARRKGAIMFDTDRPSTGLVTGDGADKARSMPRRRRTRASHAKSKPGHPGFGQIDA